MTKEALKLALEAFDSMIGRKPERVEQAITAIKEALAQPEQEPVAYDKTELNCFAQDLYDQKMREGRRGHYESMFHVIHQCIKKVAPQPEQEPVLWMMPDGNTADKWALQFYGGQKGKPLYTAPPQRTWVGLTDDEVWEAYMQSPVELDCSTDELYALSRTVEAKLKQKNGF